jgi:hypothetical protein
VNGKVNYKKPSKDDYTTAAVMKPAKGDALKPSVPSAEHVSSVSKEAHAASATANKSKSLQDAQVAAKKHADAFVQAKKAGNTSLAESHKKNAVAWAQKAQQLKKAEKASADAKKKYEAEQKAKAEAEKAAAAKAEAEQKAKQVKAENDKLKADANATYQNATHMPEDTHEQKLAKAKAFEDSAKKHGAVIQHAGKHDLPEDALVNAKLTQSQELAEKLKKEAATEKAKATAATAKLSEQADDASAKLAKKANPTKAEHEAAAKLHAQAGLAAPKSGHNGLKAHHQSKAIEHLDAAKKAGEKPPAKKAVAKKTAASAPPKAEGSDITSAVDDVIDEGSFDEPGSTGQWDDYLHAVAKAKQSPTPANLKNLATMKKALTDAGVPDSLMKSKTASLYKKLGWAGGAKKKTVAEKAATAKKAAPSKPEAPAAPDEKVPDWNITLPGPGMFKDGNAIMMLMNKPATSPAEEKAKSIATEKALAEFEKKHGKKFDPNSVEVDLYNDLHGSGSPVPQLTSSFFDEAKKAGYHHADGSEDVTNGWKPPTHTRTALLGYTGEGQYSYTPINAQLRTVYPNGGAAKQTDAITKRIKLMDEAFADAPGLSQPTVAIRKMKTDGQFPSYPPPMSEGDEYVDYGYGSTSKSTSAWSGKVVMEVRMPKGMPAIDVNHNKVVSCSTSEQEILIPRGVRYRVISDEKIGGQRKIVTEVVGWGETHPNVTI